MNVSRLMYAELLFDNPTCRNRAVAELTKQGLRVKILDWVDAHDGIALSPTVWIKIRGPFDGTADEFFALMSDVTCRCGGEVVEAGLLFTGAHRPAAAEASGSDGLW